MNLCDTSDQVQMVMPQQQQQQQPVQQPMNPMMQQQGTYQIQNQLRVMAPQTQQMPNQPYV